MLRSPGSEPGFICRFALSASSHLTHAVAASLAVGALSLCLIVTITLLATRVTMAMPLSG